MEKNVEFSIIIPVLNDYESIKTTIQAIREQEFEGRFEIIVVDNGSSDGSALWLEQQTDIQFLMQKDYPGSPYSCRNLGIDIAKGDYIILLDATCTPSKQWLESGRKYIKETSSLLFGGGVKFNYCGKVTAGKIFDSVTNVQMKLSIEKKQQAKTANLWVHKVLFEKFGKFRDGVRSGEDVRWTSHCTANGQPISYCEEAKVLKLARGATALFIKQVRVGKGQVGIWNTQGKTSANLLRSFKLLKPMRKSTLDSLVQRCEDFHIAGWMYFKVYCVSYFSGLATLFGNFIGLLKWRKS
ncbi:glycosyltransferase family A protein [Alteromonadaceae bacterium BrNp21-10]|nr:glycosyltransferase family A protein [Alteromonadaceae bacterium BrNp21-10]